MLHCPACQQEIASDSRFCGFCGFRLEPIPLDLHRERTRTTPPLLDEAIPLTRVKRPAWDEQRPAAAARLDRIKSSSLRGALDALARPITAVNPAAPPQLEVVEPDASPARQPSLVSAQESRPAARSGDLVDLRPELEPLVAQSLAPSSLSAAVAEPSPSAAGLQQPMVPELPPATSVPDRGVSDRLAFQDPVPAIADADLPEAPHDLGAALAGAARSLAAAPAMPAVASTTAPAAVESAGLAEAPAPAVVESAVSAEAPGAVVEVVGIAADAGAPASVEQAVAHEPGAAAAALELAVDAEAVAAATMATNPVVAAAVEPAPTEPSGRRFQRFPLKVEISYTSDHNFFTGFLENIGEGGLFVATHTPVSIGEVIEVSFSVPGLERVCLAVCRVRWLREYNPDYPDGVPGMGLQFAGLDPDARAAIELFIQHREPIFYED